MQLELSQQLFNCDYMKGGFDKDRKIGDGICGMEMLKQNTREKSWKNKQKPPEVAAETVEKPQLSSSYEAEEKTTVQKTNQIY